APTGAPPRPRASSPARSLPAWGPSASPVEYQPDQPAMTTGRGSGRRRGHTPPKLPVPSRPPGRTPIDPIHGDPPVPADIFVGIFQRRQESRDGPPGGTADLPEPLGRQPASLRVGGLQQLHEDRDGCRVALQEGETGGVRPQA